MDIREVTFSGNNPAPPFIPLIQNRGYTLFKAIIYMRKYPQVLIALLSLCTLAGVLWYFIPHTPVSAPSEIISETPTTTISINAIDLDTSHWLTYENTEKGFRFKYPKELEVREDTDHAVFFDMVWGVYIPLNAKYPNIKSPGRFDPETYWEYQIHIIQSEWAQNARQTEQEVITHLSETVRGEIMQIEGKNGGFVLVHTNKSGAYFVKGNQVYDMGIMGEDPEELQKITGPYIDPTLIESAARYPEFLKIFEGIYSTFEVVE